jgi:hypothetical protein
MQPQPRQLFVREQVALRSEFGRAFKGSDVIMRLGGKANRRAGQRRATASAEAAGRPRRRLERRDLALRDATASFAKPAKTLTGAPVCLRQLSQWHQKMPFGLPRASNLMAPHRHRPE